LYRAGWLLGLLLPVVGPAAAALLGLLLPRPRAESAPASSEEEQRRSAAEAARERRRGEQQVDRSLPALVDALKDRDPKVRLAAIDALAGESSKRAAKLLADARDNTLFDVRVRAVQSLARLSKEHGERLAAAKKALAFDPRSSALNSEVARLCLDYALLGVEDAATSRLLLEQARVCARAALETGEDDREPALYAARAANELGHHEEAESAYRTLLRRNANDAEALLGVAESQFARRAFALLPLTCRWVLRQAGRTLDDTAVDALRFWVRAEGRREVELRPTAMVEILPHETSGAASKQKGRPQ
jgi:hypothetical protein